MGGCLALACFLVGLPFLVLFWPATLVCWLFGVLFLLAGGRAVSRRQHAELLARLEAMGSTRSRTDQDDGERDIPPALAALLPVTGTEPELTGGPSTRSRGPSAFALLCRRAGQVMNRLARWAWSPPVRPTFVIAAAMLAVAAVAALVMRA